MKKIFDSNLFLMAGIIVLVVGGVEFYQTTVSPRIHAKSMANYNIG